ncbi:MAG: indole-3-glycerol phosphate synthase TrpC, partial [Ktedonobacterales bacterium]
PAPRAFRDAITPRSGGPARLIAEIKRASPSKGLLAAAFDPVAQARAYARGGAAAISVLTEPHFFQGSLDHLRAVRQAVDLPLLCKDFIVDAYQVYEARAAGADAVLLICALLDDAALAALLGITHALGMEALVEAHDSAEVERALAANAGIIGVNSRDLRTFEVDTAIIAELRPRIPVYRRLVAESGIADARGAGRARAFGADAILAGEALMRAADPEATARELANAPGGATVTLFNPDGRPFVKLCGLSTPQQVALAAEMGADAVGLVFYPPSHRNVSREQARAITSAVRAVGASQSGEPLAIGVFVNETPETVAAIAEVVHLDAVQLSGDETPQGCAEVATLTGLLVIKALRLRAAADLATLDEYTLAGATPLLDTPAAGGASYGGTGQTGDWTLAREAARRWPVILSGGLTAANVAAALAQVMPRGLDVSSGIETGGVKDTEKMRAFVHAARSAG